MFSFTHCIVDENYGTVTEVNGIAASPPDQGASVGWPPSFAQVKCLQNIEH